MVYIKDDISKHVKEFAAIMKQILWTGVRRENGSHLDMCKGFVYSAPPNSYSYNPSFTRELQREINKLKDLHPNSEFLLLRDMKLRHRGGCQ
jgi:hypothetical protein